MYMWVVFFTNGKSFIILKRGIFTWIYFRYIHNYIEDSENKTIAKYRTLHLNEMIFLAQSISCTVLIQNKLKNQQTADCSINPQTAPQRPGRK